MCVLGLIFALTLWGTVSTEEQSASFYGESYVSIPLQDASSSTLVHLFFKTHRPHGLLLLADGSTDYLLIEVKSGMVEVRIDLGSGEASVFSSPTIRLDDHQWHEVTVNRTLGSMELTVDGVQQGSVDTPGSFHDLNIENGVFLGGVGAFSSKIQANLKDFRGCMKNVLYNGNDIIASSRNMMSAKNAFEIAWTCDGEFSAGADVPVSFLSETSFIAFSHFHVRERGAFACDFKTRSDTAVILFNSGRGNYKEDFMSLEIIDGKPKFSVNCGSGLVEVILLLEVNDGKWHQLDLSISQSSVELRVDNVRNITRFGGESSYLNLAGHLFVGGVGLKARSHALHLGLESLQGDRSLKGSMLGCIRHIVINSRPYGFREVQISRHVDPVCTWSFPCSSDPCIENAECVESGTDFQCVCDKPICTKEKPNIVQEEDIQDLIAIQPLRVQEGGEAVINTNTIDVVFDYRSFHLREIAVKFQVVVPPRYGRLEVDKGRRQSESFTLLDLLTGKVTYVHDGTDTETDDATVELSISGNSDLPQKMQGNFEFVLPIKINPHNDPPKFSLPSGNQISITAETKLQITTNIIDVKDPDTLSRNLHYNVKFFRPTKSFFENYNSTGQPTNFFTHQDVIEGSIWFVHREDPVVDVVFNVTDDSSLSDVVNMRFRVVSLELDILHNTGLTVVYGTSAVLHAQNLTTLTNVPLENLEVRYRLTKLPLFGQIQRLQHGVDEWTDVDTFTQRHLNSSRIRYTHFSKDFTAKSDEFFFVVTAKDAETVSQMFKIVFMPVVLTVQNNNRLIIHQVPHAVLDNSSIHVSTPLGQLDSNSLVFTVFRASKLGAIYLSSERRILNPLDFEGLKPVQEGGNFSQTDLNSGHVYFKFYKTAFDRLEDFVDFTASYPSSANVAVRMWVEYVPLDTAIRFTNNGLRDVTEGGQKVIDKSSLYLEMDEYKNFLFSIIRPPKHGNISLINPRTSALEVENVQEFNTADILAGKVIYQHDDTENNQDSFAFTALPVFPSENDMPEEVQEFSGTFHISVMMRNDNPPERVVDKVFQVVTNGRRKITLNDLAFTDKDINFNISTLQYRRQSIPNGEILHRDLGSPVYQFTQQDIEQETLVFQHKGASIGHAAIFVSDGQFYWTGLFEIKASDPYILIKNNTGLVVRKGGNVIITSRNISVESNMDHSARSFNIIIAEEPQHGSVKVEGENAGEFTYADILNQIVEYQHSGDNAVEDKFQFVVVHGDVQMQGSFPIMIEDESMRHPPEIVHNRMLKVKEGETNNITQSHLFIQHPALRAEEVIVIVRDPPKHGNLQIGATQFSSNEAVQFSQDDINRGRVKYIQTKSGVTEDRFVFDVDSDSQAVRNVVFSIEIVPISLPVQAGNLTVKEGKAVLLSKETLKPVGAHYESENIFYKIVHSPVHGYVFNTEKPKSYNLPFTSKAIASGKVKYQHDDSESIEDMFTIVATQEDGNLQSQPVHIYVHILPSDDQPPRVIVNKGLSVWADSVTLLTSEHLHAEDPDTRSDQIIFKVASPSNGHLAFFSNTSWPVLQFSQRDIDAGQVAFVHKGDSHGQFNFQATDGTNSDISRTFRVRAHPVVLELVRSGPLMVFPNTIHPVTNSSLLAATTSSNFSKPIIFTVIDPKPREGKVVTMVAGRPLEMKSFTQQDVNEGKVFYQHTGYSQQWQHRDSIHLDISADYAKPLQGEMCSVDISFGNINSENQVMLLGLYPASVKEGGSIFITRTHFDSTDLLQRLHAFKHDISMTFEVISPPEHGTLYLDGIKITSAKVFTQADIDNEKLKYQHDDSDTLKDSFAVSVEIHEKAENGDVPTQMPRHIVNFTIQILPVNDQKFWLVTRNPSLKVLQGMHATLTRENLLTEDPDTPPSEIQYSILSGPTDGRLVQASHPSVQVKAFTQEDIDQERLIFFQNGAKKSGAMYFKVWDGKFPALYKMLDIFVVPVKIDVSNVRPVELLQSESSVHISGKYLNISTNGNRNKLLYNITGVPEHGHILHKSAVVSHFSQQVIDSDALLYVMENLTNSEDSFSYSIYMEDIDVMIKDQKMLITVKPLVKQMPLIAPAGATVAITKASLDVTELAARTGDNPSFEVIEPPRHGQICRKLRRKREVTSPSALKPVEQFTFEDILYAKIFYVSNASLEQGPADTFSYILHANGVQPARGRFFINLDESEKNVEENDATKTSLPGSEETTSRRIAETDESMQAEEAADSNIAMIVGIVLGVLLVLALVAVFVVLFWRWQRAEDEREREKERRLRNRPRPYISGPLQLQQPHVHIEPQQSILALGERDDEDERHLVRDSSNLSSLPIINISHDPAESVGVKAGHSKICPFPMTPRSPDLTRVEISPAVPDCKVTPLIEIRNESERPASTVLRSESAVAAGQGTGTDLYDWTLMDPDLLQHCRTETPILRDNQYWV